MTSALPPRVAIVQAELDRFEAARFLEIGLGAGDLFVNVHAGSKTGVDPAGLPRRIWLRHPVAMRGARVARVTSDAFFGELMADDTFDVVFVDGLHTHGQVLRDVESALRHLAKDGVVLVHDCNPPHAAAAAVDEEEVRDLLGAGRAWCGDVWKAVVELRATRDDLDVSVLDTDFGIGVIRRGRSSTLDLEPGRIPAMGYEDLAANRETLLGLVKAPQ